MRKIFIFLVFSAVIGIGCARRANSPARPEPANGTEVVCAQDGPVCGEDGITYASECEASKVGVPIVYTGACAPLSSLTFDERMFLLWLLRARLDAGMPEVPVHHERTQSRQCDSCYTYYYYRWGNEGTAARLDVRSGMVESALDTTGYDYVAHTQGSPRSLEL